jgi:hypothetical protein
MKVLTRVTFVISDHKTSEPYPRLRGANLLSSSVAPLYHVCIIQPGRKRASISPVYNPRCPIPIDKNIAHVKIHVARDARNRTSGKTIPYCVLNDGLQRYQTSSGQTKLPSQRKNRKDRHRPRRSSCRYQRSDKTCQMRQMGRYVTVREGHLLQLLDIPTKRP